jgi:predicted nuclease of predicted toxin-antitoxin system
LKPQEFPILADENIHPGTVAWLRARGCDVLEVRGGELVGSEDLTLMRFAYAQGRIILTHDSDFGALSIARLEPIIGLVFLRPGHVDPGFTVYTLEAIFNLNLDLRPPFVLVAKRTGDNVRVRVRSL